MQLQSRSVRAEISNAVVSLHRHYFGVGPPRAKTYITENLVVCVLEGGATAIEQALSASGRDAETRRVRLDVLSTTAAPALRAKVEAATGTSVEAYTAGYDCAADVTTLTFLLASCDAQKPPAFESPASEAAQL